MFNEFLSVKSCQAKNQKQWRQGELLNEGKLCPVLHLVIREEEVKASHNRCDNQRKRLRRLILDALRRYREMIG